MIEFLQTLSILVVVGYIVIVAEVIALYSVLRSKAWSFLMAAFIIACFLRFWDYIRLPFALAEAKAKGYPIPETISAIGTEVWIKIAAGYAVIILTAIGLDILRRNLKFRLRLTK